MPQPLKFLSERLMVVNLSVECDDRVVVIADDGLIPASQVDNLEPDRAQRHLA